MTLIAKKRKRKKNGKPALIVMKKIRAEKRHTKTTNPRKNAKSLLKTYMIAIIIPKMIVIILTMKMTKPKMTIANILTMMKPNKVKIL